MAKYVVQYEMRKDGFGVKSASTPGGSPKTVECESEATAIQIAESHAKAKHPGYDFVLKKVEKR